MANLYDNVLLYLIPSLTVRGGGGGGGGGGYGEGVTSSCVQECVRIRVQELNAFDRVLAGKQRLASEQNSYDLEQGEASVAGRATQKYGA